MSVTQIESAAMQTPAPPGHTDLEDLTATLRASLDDYLTGKSTEPYADAARDAALAELRVRGQARVFRDLDDNLAAVEGLYDDACRGRDLHDVDLPVERDLVRRLHAQRAKIRATDPYGSGDVEEQVWIDVQVFYCDAIDCVMRLLARLDGGQPSPGRYDEDGNVRRYGQKGISARSPLQAVVNTAEVAVANPFQTRVLRTFFSTVTHLLWHQFVPWGELRWHEFEKTLLGWLSPNGLSRLRGERRGIVRVAGIEHLTGNVEIYDAQARCVRHNVVIAGGHRAGYLDLPLFAGLLRDVPHIVWANNSFYTPGMARKLARSRTAIAVRGVGRLPFNDAVDLTIRIFAEDRLPLFIMADGATKNLLYGQYLRVKRGLRVLVDECARRQHGSDRRTFVVPMTYDDPLGYLLGFEDEIQVTVHPPLEITEPTSPEAYTSAFDESAVNGGDPLLNQLEALYFVSSLQARVGLIAPDVIGAVKRWREEPPHGIRDRLARRFNMSIYDLARLSAAQCREARNQTKSPNGAPYESPGHRPGESIAPRRS